MIKIVNPTNKINAEDILGKYVLVDRNFHWASIGEPRIVSHVSGSRVYVQQQKSYWDEHEKIHFLLNDGKLTDDGYIYIKSVACICDTTDEVNHVLRENEKLGRDYFDFIKQAKKRILELDGVIVNSTASHDMTPSTPQSIDDEGDGPGMS